MEINCSLRDHDNLEDYLDYENFEAKLTGMKGFREIGGLVAGGGVMAPADLRLMTGRAGRARIFVDGSLVAVKPTMSLTPLPWSCLNCFRVTCRSRVDETNFGGNFLPQNLEGLAQ